MRPSIERCEAQIGGVLAVLEKERAAVATPYWFDERIGHADIAVACVLRFSGEAHPNLFNARYPALKAHAARCEALPPFQEIVQPLSPPKGSKRLLLPPSYRDAPIGVGPEIRSLRFSSLRGAKRRSNPSLCVREALWIASRSRSSGAHSRDPLARNDDLEIVRATN